MSSPATDGTRTSLREYAAESARPLVSMAFIAPLLVVYELAGVVLGPHALRNGADTWLRCMLESIGFGQYFLLPILTCSILLAWHHTRQDSWQLQGGVLTTMLLESTLFALVLFGLAHLQRAFFAPVTMSMHWHECDGRGVGDGESSDWVLRRGYLRGAAVSPDHVAVHRGSVQVRRVHLAQQLVLGNCHDKSVVLRRTLPRVRHGRICLRLVHLLVSLCGRTVFLGTVCRTRIWHRGRVSRDVRHPRGDHLNRVCPRAAASVLRSLSGSICQAPFGRCGEHPRKWLCCDSAIGL